MGVKRDKPNAFKDLEVKLKELDGYTAKLGWFENAKEEDGTPSAYVASIQEYGSGKIPPRLGMRETKKEKQSVWKDFAKGASKKVLDGSWNGRDAMTALAYQAHKDIYKRINSNPGPPLSDLTLALRKKREQGIKVTGSIVWETWRKLKAGEAVALSTNTQTLVDTSRMLNNLDVLVENK